MTAPLTEAQARAVVQAAGCKLREAKDGWLRAIDRSMVVQACAKTPAGLAQTLRERAESDLAWKRRAFERAQREYDEAYVARNAIEEAAGAEPAREAPSAPRTVDYLFAANLSPEDARPAVRRLFEASLETVRASATFCLDPDQALSCLAEEIEVVDWSQLPMLGIAKAAHVYALVERAATSWPAGAGPADDSPAPPSVAPRDLPAVLAGWGGSEAGR